MARPPRASHVRPGVGGAGVLSRLTAARGRGPAGRELVLERIRHLSGRELALLLGEVYRQRRYVVVGSWLAGGDTGDVVLRRQRSRMVVHGRHWRRPVVGGEEVDQLWAAVESRRADAGVLVTCGRFSREARAAARGRPLELIDGAGLFAMVERSRGAMASAVLAPGERPGPPHPVQEIDARARACYAPRMSLLATRTLVLMPMAMALNIALGTTVQQALKLPIYLDSLGTILAGVLAGPLAGLLTGALTNLIWAYVLPPPLQAPTAGPFAITAAVIGLLAGLWGRLGVFRSRRATDPRSLGLALATALLVVLLALYTFARAYASPDAFKANAPFGSPAFFTASRLIFVVVLIAFAGLTGWAIFVRRDAGAMLALTAGLVTGLVAALVSAPIAAFVFGGVTGSGTDVIVAAFRASGAGLYQATLQQGLLSDPLDKMITSLLAFTVLAGMPSRVVARFPNGERIVQPS